jgi:two-component system sensor histidine kinase KdpD
MSEKDRGQAQAWLRIYLGYASGVGKTYAMLNEGRRRKERGTDVVIGAVQAHGRPRTLEAIGDLELLGAGDVTGDLPELDVAAVLKRQPAVVLIDNLEHRNPAGSRNGHRYQDVQQLLSTGVNVITTVNLQQIDTIQADRTDVHSVDGCVPAELVLHADEIEVIDQTPEALQKRFSHGNILVSEDGTDPLAADTLLELREQLWAFMETQTAIRRRAYALRRDQESREHLMQACSGLAQSLKARLIGRRS